MIGWVHYRNDTSIHPVLCWYTLNYKNPTAQKWVATTTGLRWFLKNAVPLDTEAEVAALLLQGYKLMAPTTGGTRRAAALLQGRTHQ